MARERSSKTFGCSTTLLRMSCRVAALCSAVPARVMTDAADPM